MVDVVGVAAAAAVFVAIVVAVAVATAAAVVVAVAVVVVVVVVALLCYLNKRPRQLLNVSARTNCSCPSSRKTAAKFQLSNKCAPAV